MSEGAKRLDTDKPRTDLLDPVALNGIAAVLAFGAKKYAAHNWRKGMNWGRCIASLLRHTFAFMNGEDLDSESGLPHVDHIACNAMFLCRYFRDNKSLDDRFKLPITVPCSDGGFATLSVRNPHIGDVTCGSGGVGGIQITNGNAHFTVKPPGDTL